MKTGQIDSESNQYRKTLRIMLTNNKVAKLIYPTNITVEDIRLIQIQLDKIHFSIIPSITTETFRELGKHYKGHLDNLEK